MEVYVPISRDELKDRIKKTRGDNFEEHLLVTLYSLKSYAASLFKFGLKSEAAKDALKVRKEFVRILKEENSLFRFLLNNINVINVDAASEFIDGLDDLNEQTVKYYYHVLDDIDEAVELGEEHRAKRSPRHFETLTESRSYREEVMALVENSKSIKEFLGYPEEFWELIKGKYHTIEMCHEVADGMPFVTSIYDNDHNIVDLRMVCPEPTDLYTALIAIKTYAKAYEVYKAIIGRHAALYDVKAEDKLKLKYKDNLFEKAQKRL